MRAESLVLSHSSILMSFYSKVKPFRFRNIVVKSQNLYVRVQSPTRIVGVVGKYPISIFKTGSSFKIVYQVFRDLDVAAVKCSRKMQNFWRVKTIEKFAA